MPLPRKKRSLSIVRGKDPPTNKLSSAGGVKKVGKGSSSHHKQQKYEVSSAATQKKSIINGGGGGGGGAAAAAATAAAKQRRPIGGSSKHGGNSKHAGSGSGSGSGSSNHGAEYWAPASVIDRQAAEAVARLMRAAETRTGGASVKSLTLAPHVVHKKPTFAVTCETLKHLPLLKELAAEAQLASPNARHPQLQPAAAYVLAYEALFGEGLRARGRAERAVAAAAPALRAALQRLLKEEGVPDAAAWLALRSGSGASGGNGAAAAAPAAVVAHPRWVRVNTLKLDPASALARLKAEGFAAEPDALLPGGALLRLPHGTDLHAHELVAAGALILQSKASCMPCAALAPRAGWTVLDACAAPGNKTTHAAACVGARGRVLAFDKDARRLRLLEANAARAGAGRIIAAECADFLSLDPRAPRFADVRAIILDPSCSGSGTGVSRMDHLLPKASSGICGGGGGSGGGGGEAGNGGGGGGGEGEDAAEAKRVEALARFQEAALRHALRFPGARRVAYSTCSVHRRENEGVVAAVLPAAAEAGYELADALPQGLWPRRGIAGSLPGGLESRLVRTDAAEDGTDGFFVALFVRKRHKKEEEH